MKGALAMQDEYENEIIPALGAEPPAEEPAETTAEEEAGAEPAGPETPEVPTGDDTPAETEEAKKAKGVQKRIDELTRQKHEAARDAEYWKAQATQGQQQPEPQPEQLPLGFKPKPTREQFFESMDPDADFVEALTDWKADLRDHRRSVSDQQKSEEARAKEVTTAHNERATAARAEHEDYDEVISSASDIVFSQEMTEAILYSDQSAELAYYLGKNKDELKRIAGLPVLQQVKEIGRIEAKLTTKVETPPPTKKLTQAPEPIKPVGNKEKATPANPDEMSDDDWLKYERERLRKTGRLY
jgi:dsDNA-binding SOS-regulon protein